MRLRLVDDETGHRADVDDRSALLFQHLAAEGAAAPEQAVDVDVHVEAPVLVAGLLGRHVAFRDPRVVDQNVDPAVPVQDPCRHVVDLGRTGDVEHLADGLDARLLQLGHHAFHAVGLHVGDDDLGARFPHGLRAGFADSLTGTGQNRNATVESQFF